MSASTRSSVADAALAGALWLVVAVGTVDARPLPPPPLPAEVESSVRGLEPRGGGEFRWFGLTVYDGFLWALPHEELFDTAFALDLHYRRDLDGIRIAERSAAEIARLGYGTAEERERWSRFMHGIFPDIRRGERLTGLYVPGRGARFFHGGRLIGESPDPVFARAFFAIWLDPRTSRPDFRRVLLGLR